MALRILHAMEPGFGGVLRHVEGLVEHQLRHGHRISLAYSSYRPSERLQPLVEKVSDAGGSVIDLGVSNAPGTRDLKATWQLLRLARDQAVDLIHAHSSKAGALARPVARLCRRPCFYTPNAYFGLGRSGLTTGLFNLVERILWPMATTINVSPEELEFARLRLGVRSERQVLIPNGVDCQLFLPASPEQKARVRAQFGLPPEALVLGSLGRLCFQKDPQTLYRSFARFLAHRPDAYLLHVGEGDMDHAVEVIKREQGLGERVRHLPSLVETTQFYQALDGFVLTSRYEGLPISALEALACNLPLLLSQAPGNGSFAALGLSHLYYAPVGNEGAFTNLFQRWAEAIARSGPVNHREVAIRSFSLEQCCDRVLNCYQQQIRG